MSEEDRKKRRGTTSNSTRNLPVPVTSVVLVEHKECGTSFLKDEACPKCGKKLLEG